jgi:non-heme chloroperoxidase
VDSPGLDAVCRPEPSGRLKGQLDCIAAVSETDFTGDLERFEMATLVVHGDDGQILPICDPAHLSAKLVKAR